MLGIVAPGNVILFTLFWVILEGCALLCYFGIWWLAIRINRFVRRLRDEFTRPG